MQTAKGATAQKQWRSPALKSWKVSGCGIAVLISSLFSKSEWQQHCWQVQVRNEIPWGSCGPSPSSLPCKGEGSPGWMNAQLLPPGPHSAGPAKPAGSPLLLTFLSGSLPSFSLHRAPCGACASWLWACFIYHYYLLQRLAGTWTWRKKWFSQTGETRPSS